MKKTSEGVKVSIMGREFAVACADDQKDALSKAALHLDKKMREIQGSGKVIGHEKCAIMAALNIAHELLASRARDDEAERLGATVSGILEKLDVAMKEQAQFSPSGTH